MNTSRLFQKYGQPAVFSDTVNLVSVSFRAFVRPLRYKNKIYLRGTYTEIGRNQQDYYLYFGPADIDVSGVNALDKTLTVNGREYIVDRMEHHCIGEHGIYNWAIVRPVITAEEVQND